MMKRSRYTALLAINAALLAALAASVLAPTSATAQRDEANRARGDYTMLAGQVQGMEENAIYLVDVNNREVIAVRWDRNNHSFSPLGYRDLDEDARRSRGGGR